jgi:hypothetical protein
VTCISFSASANVAADISGPAPGAVPKAGGVPGVADDEPAGAGAGGVGSVLRQAAATANAPIGAVIRNCLRVFMTLAPCSPDLPAHNDASLRQKSRIEADAATVD